MPAVRAAAEELRRTGALEITQKGVAIAGPYKGPIRLRLAA